MSNKSKWFKNIIVIIFWVLSIVFICAFYEKSIRIHKGIISDIEYVDSMNNYNKVYYEERFKELKKTNKQLYDSLKDYKDMVSYLVQFKYEKEYSTGVVHTKPKKQEVIHDTIYKDNALDAINFEYESEPNDTFQYKLVINSEMEPNWYSLKAKLKEKFTIVNKSDDEGLNHITIGSQGNGNISDVTVFKKEEKKKFWKRITYGPGVTAGYDPINKRWGLVAGATVSINLGKQ